jgi:hypothetical protein
MKKTLLLLISFVFAITSYSQDWTAPVQINTLHFTYDYVVQTAKFIKR